MIAVPDAENTHMHSISTKASAIQLCEISTNDSCVNLHTTTYMCIHTKLYKNASESATLRDRMGRRIAETAREKQERKQQSVANWEKTVATTATTHRDMMCVYMTQIQLVSTILEGKLYFSLIRSEMQLFKK